VAGRGGNDVGKWSGGSGGGVCDKEATPVRENDLVGAM
jgi:hypothetical protein